jgi:glycosyltransferase involved in cell wall biosynthesis
MSKKGMDVLLSAWAELLERYPNIVLLSLGGEQVPDAVRERTLAWQGQILFVLNTENVLPYYQAADIFVLPSLAEGLSNALLEAQACGLPSVVTAVGGNTDVVRDGENGLVVTANQSAALADALVRLIEDKNLRESMSKAARERITAFSIYEVARQYDKLYQDLLVENRRLM